MAGELSYLDELIDVDLDSTAPTDGQALLYDADSDTWIPGTVAGGTRAGWTLVESASQPDFDATTDAGAVLAVYRWGVDGSGTPYFNSAGVSSGEEAALWLDDAGNYVLVELDL